MKQICLLSTHQKTISVVLDWPIWCCSYTKEKVVDDDRPFCLEVPWSSPIQRWSKKVSSWSWTSMKRACNLQMLSVFTIYNPFDLKYPCVSNRSEPGTNMSFSWGLYQAMEWNSNSRISETYQSCHRAVLVESILKKFQNPRHRHDICWVIHNHHREFIASEDSQCFEICQAGRFEEDRLTWMHEARVASNAVVACW